MEDSQEPPLAEFIPIEPTEMPLNLTDDIQMAETDHLVNNSESMLDEPKSEASVSEAYVRYTTAAEPTSPSHDKEPSSQNISLSIESAVLIDSGQSSFGQPTPSLNLGASSLSKPASQVSREKARERARATQALLVQQYTAKNNAASAPSASVNLSDAGEPAASLDHGSAEADSEMAAFEKLKAAHEIKKQAGTSDIETDVTYLKAEAKEMARRRKLEADELYELNRSEDEDDDESETLFVTGNTPASRATGTPASHATGTPKRPRVPGGKRRAADKSMAPPKKRAKTTNEPTGRSLARRKDGKGLTNDEYERTLQAMNSKQGASKKQPAKSKPGHNISNVASLLNGTDVFRDTNDVADRSNQPAFAAGITHRDKALRALIASVPQEEQGLAAGDKKLLENSLKDFTGQGSCKPSPDGTGWTLRGMNCTLKHYQVLGIAFMRKRETQKVRPRGGILADEMGLGKTIQMIANIINGKPNAGEPKTTLIVASPALVGQWHAEILKFTQTKKENKKHGISRIIQHRAGYRQGGDHDQIKEAIEASDICLTTYSEVQRSYPKNIVPPEITTERAKQIWWSDYFANNKGVFHDIKFHRVILDEAQTIKNHTGQCSMACRALNSEFSWAITGTPLVNGIREMYPYLKFLKHPHAGSMRTFEANFCAPNDPTGAQKLGVFLKQIIIRRTHKDLLFGARLLDLPTPKQNVIYLEFNGVERSVYEIVKQRFIQRINTITKRVGIQAQYSCVWTMLLRLRQICSHIFLIQDTIMDLLEREDFEKLNDITKEVEGESKENSDMLARLSHMLKTHRALVMQAGPANAEAAGVDVHVVPGGHNNMNVGNASDLGGRHGKTYAFGKLLESAAKTDQMAAIKARAKCCSCRELPYDAQITSCHHIYCKGCIMELQALSARARKNAARCMECGVQFTGVKPVQEEIEHVETEAESTLSGSSKSKSKKKKNDDLDWISQGPILPSAKTIAAKAQILEWLSEKPDCKIIIYTQFLPMIRIMGRVCETERWPYLKYSGAMSHTARDKALQDFASKPEVRVLLMSLKCGGLGLNIVAASRVILIDPWWNDAVEQQAFCRVFRIGQTDETRLARFCIKNSIDAAMFAVKERKTAEIEKVMEQTKRSRDLKDLMQLFGAVDEDEDGHPFIFPDPEDHEDEAIPRFYEPDNSGSFFNGGPQTGFMGNDI